MTALASTVPPRRRRPTPRRTLISIAVALALAQYGSALAGPGGAQVVAGQVAVSQPTAQQTVVTQGSASAIVNWQQFSIARNESVDFRQPGTASVILNRVTGANPSEIYGRLSANGQVFLVNPGGVLFGRTAQVDVGGLVASTLDIADGDFLAGHYRFAAGATGGSVVNQGRLQAAERGTVALLGAKVNNDGTISAQLGTAALAAGDKIALDFNGDGLTKIRVDKAAVAALVDNRGMVVADGGQAILTAHAAQALAETVLNQQGVVRARSLVERNGKISLDGGERGVTLASGTLDVSGTAPGLKGGTAEVLGQHVGLAGDALVDARGDAGGGTILVGGDYGGANPLVRNANATFAGAGTVLRADATGSGDGGKIILWSDQSTRMFGTASAGGGPGGGNGGLIETSGKFLSVAGSKVSAAAPRGRAGQWLLDPDNIRITTCFGDCGDSNITRSPGPQDFISTGDAILTPATLVAALGTGTSVTVTTSANPQSTSFGDITVEENVGYLGATDASLTLAAHNDIVINPGVQISSGSGRLNLTLRSDRDAAGGGSIFMNPASAILTNGGNVLFAGGASTDPAVGFASRVQMDNGAQITTTRPQGGDGSVTMRADYNGTFFKEAILLSGAAIRTGAGAVSLQGATRGNSNNVDIPAGNAGVRLQQALPEGPPVPSTIETTSGNISITGSVSAPSDAFGYGGLITGVSLYDSSIQTGSGSVVINGAGGDTSIIGETGGRAIGIDASNFQLHANQGRVSLTGIGGDAIGDILGTFDGVHAERSTIDTTAGAIDIRGRAGVATGAAAPTGVALVGSTIATGGPLGAITISGESPGASPGVSFSDAVDPGRANAIGGASTAGVISIRALNAGGNMLALSGTIQGSGVLNLRPGGVSAVGALTEAPAVPIGLFGTGAPFALVQAALTQIIQPGFSSVVIGSATHTGLITVAAGADLAGRYDITLQNGGAGSAGIAFPGSFANAGKLLTLSSGGTVTQTQDGPIVAGSLLLHGTQPQSNFQLTNPLNAVGTFSVRFDAPKGAADPNFGDVNFANSGDLAFGPLTGTGFDAATNLPLAINAGNAFVAGDLLAHAGRDLILNQNIATGASDITLVADRVFMNPANATLLPGGGGHWKVYADTWVGEIPGPLTGTGPTPNLYNCGFNAVCTAPPSGTENMFVYRQQPRVDIALNVPNPFRTYGSPNPPFNFTATPLVKQDRFGTAVTGAYATGASAASNVQSYPIDGRFTSPAGYLVVATPGTLRVDPATLAYLATPVVRLVGTTGPPLTGSVSGFVNGDTQAGATTGTPAFSTPASITAPPGRYAINGAGLAARNYVFVQAPSNATALRVEPAIFGLTPSIYKDVTFETSALYGKNFGVQRLCAGTGPLARADGAPDSTDLLAVEWSRVKGNPNLSNCIGLVQRFSCDNF